MGGSHPSPGVAVFPQLVVTAGGNSHKGRLSCGLCTVDCRSHRRSSFLSCPCRSCPKLPVRVYVFSPSLFSLPTQPTLTHHMPTFFLFPLLSSPLPLPHSCKQVGCEPCKGFEAIGFGVMLSTMAVLLC